MSQPTERGNGLVSEGRPSNFLKNKKKGREKYFQFCKTCSLKIELVFLVVLFCLANNCKANKQISTHSVGEDAGGKDGEAEWEEWLTSAYQRLKQACTTSSTIKKPVKLAGIFKRSIHFPSKDRLLSTSKPHCQQLQHCNPNSPSVCQVFLGGLQRFLIHPCGSFSSTNCTGLI